MSDRDGQTALSLSLVSGPHITECLGGKLRESEPREQAAWRTGSITVSMLKRWTVFYPLCAMSDPCDSGSFVFKSPCIKVPDGTFRDKSKTQVGRGVILLVAIHMDNTRLFLKNSPLFLTSFAKFLRT